MIQVERGLNQRMREEETELEREGLNRRPPESGEPPRDREVGNASSQAKRESAGVNRVSIMVYYTGGRPRKYG